MRLIDAEPLKELFPDNGEGSWTYNATAKAYIDAQPEQQNARTFQGVIVEYPTNSTYPEYEGKPYFLIKYTEDGQDFIGYGTYKPDVLSEYLKKYFMPSAQPERKTGHWIAITSRNNTYKCSVCGRLLVNITDGKNKVAKNYPYCHCGADMRSTERNSNV